MGIGYYSPINKRYSAFAALMAIYLTITILALGRGQFSASTWCRLICHQARGDCVTEVGAMAIEACRFWGRIRRRLSSSAAATPSGWRARAGRQCQASWQMMLFLFSRHPPEPPGGGSACWRAKSSDYSFTTSTLGRAAQYHGHRHFWAICRVSVGPE